VPPFDSEEARRIVTDQIGAPIEECFAAFEDRPFASGSIGQVHRARTRDGQDVVVKVKRPNAEELVRLDLHILKWMAGTVERLVPDLARFGPRRIIEEYERLLMREMDFISEASSTARFEDAFADDECITIPHVHWDLTGPQVLTLTELRGRSIEELLGGEMADQIDRPLLARCLVNAYLKQFFDMRLFHADPHPGNMLVRPPARLGLIDFGQVGLISDELAGQLVVILVAMIYRETYIVVDVLADMGAVGPETDMPAVARSLRLLLDKYHGRPLKRLDLVTVFYEVTDILRSYNVTLPQETVMVLKTLVTGAGVALRLDPEMDLVTILKPRLKGLVADRMAPPRILRTLGISLWHVVGMLKSAPAQLRAALRILSRGRWNLNVHHDNIDQLAEEMDRSSNRLSFAIVIAAIIVGSSVVISTSGQFKLGGMPVQWIGVVGYVFAGMLGAGLLWAILRSGRLY
jgi:ubiquinone biosynthesis protein